MRISQASELAYRKLQLIGRIQTNSHSLQVPIEDQLVRLDCRYPTMRQSISCPLDIQTPSPINLTLPPSPVHSNHPSEPPAHTRLHLGPNDPLTYFLFVHPASLSATSTSSSNGGVRSSSVSELSDPNCMGFDWWLWESARLDLAFFLDALERVGWGGADEAVYLHYASRSRKLFFCSCVCGY